MYSLNLTANVIVLVSLSLLYTLMLVIAVLYLHSDLRGALAVTYIFLAIAFIFSYSLARIPFRGALGPYIISTSSLVVIIPAYIVLRQSRESLLAHLLLVSSLPVAILDTTGYALIAMTVPYMIFAMSVKDLMIYTISFLAVYLPYTLLPNMVNDMNLVPYPKILNIAYDVPGGEWSAFMVIQLMALTYAVIGVLQLIISEKLLPRIKDLKDVIIHSLVSYVFGVIAVTTVILGANTLVKPLTTTQYTYSPIIPITTLALALITSIIKMIREASNLRTNALSLITYLRSRLLEFESLLTNLSDLGSSVRRSRDTIVTYLKGIEDINVKLGRAILITPKRLENYIAELNKIRESLNNIERDVLTQFSLVVNNVKEMYSRVSIITGLRYVHIEDLMTSLANVKELKEVPEALMSLKKVLKTLCEVYVKVADAIVSNSYEVLGLKLDANTSLTCTESLIMSEVLALYSDLIEDLGNKVGNDVMNVYTGIIRLGRGLESVVSDLRILQNTNVMAEFEDLIRNLKSLPEFEITPYRALVNLMEVCRKLRKSLTKLVESVINEASYKESQIEDITTQLGIKLDYIKTYKIRLNSIINDYLRRDVTCKEVVTYLNSTELLLIRDLTSYVNVLNLTLRRLKILPLLIKYLNDRLEEGAIIVDDIPISKDLLNWLLSIYLSSNANVIFDGRTLKRELRGTS